MFSCFECARAVRSLVCVPCFVLERGVRIPALMSWVSVRVGVRTLALRFLSLCECAVSSSLDCTLSCPRVFCCVARSSCFYRLRAFVLYLVLFGTQLVYSLAACFRVVMSCVNTWLMSFLISCVFVSCFAHGWWFVCWPCACVLFCVSTWLLSYSFLCAMCSHVNLSWPHPSCYLFID